jgi:hypothetical protein
MKKPRPSRNAQNIAKNSVWYYEDESGIDVFAWKNGQCHNVRIPWRRLMISAKRCGRKLP